MLLRGQGAGKQAEAAGQRGISALLIAPASPAEAAQDLPASLWSCGMIGAKDLLLNGQRLAEKRFCFIEALLVHQDGGKVVEALRCHEML